MQMSGCWLKAQLTPWESVLPSSKLVRPSFLGFFRPFTHICFTLFFLDLIFEKVPFFYADKHKNIVYFSWLIYISIVILSFCYRVMTLKRFCARNSWAFLQCEQTAFLFCAASLSRYVEDLKEENPLGMLWSIHHRSSLSKIGILASSAMKLLDNRQSFM